MPITITRTNSHLIGTGGVGGAASISANATNTSTALSMTGGGVIEASIMLSVIIGSSAPTTNITINYLVSEDGTNYIQDGPSISLTPSASTTYGYRYDPPDGCQSVEVQVINGATNAITAWCDGCTLAVS